MIYNVLQNFHLEDYAMLSLAVIFSVSFLIAFFTFPTILYVANKKHLMDEPDSRSMHSKRTPTLGGIGVFFSLVVVMTFIGAVSNAKVMLLVVGGITILFFVGLKDDLTVLSPKSKLLGQLFATLLVVVLSDIRIIGFSQILDINVLPYWGSIVFTVFVYVLIVNAYNLIDGIDGLAASIAVLVSIVYTVLFYNSNELGFALLSLALCGSLLAFLRFNFSVRFKLFMGDTGTMIVGFILAFFTVSFISQSQLNLNALHHKDSPAIALALLFYPLVDTCRIFFIRIFILKGSPFKADKNHIHHRFIQSGFSHVQTAALIVVVNFVVIAIAFNSTHLNLNTQIGLLFVYGSVLFSLPLLWKRFICGQSTSVNV